MYNQLHAGLKLTLVENLTVLGSLTYQQLYLAVKQDEQRLADLQRCKQYCEHLYSRRDQRSDPKSPVVQPSSNMYSDKSLQRLCGSTEHMACECRKKRNKSTPALEEKWLIGKQSNGKTYQSDGKSGARTVQSSNLDPTSFLYSFDDNDNDGTDEAQIASAPKKRVRMVLIKDKGSQQCMVTVNFQGFPVKKACGGADIIIINGRAFKKVAAVSCLKKKAFIAAVKTPVEYDIRPFKLDGHLGLGITFVDCTLHTTVYLKMDALDVLLLSKGTCHQLGIISYYPNVGIHPLQDSVTCSPCGESQAGRICTTFATQKQNNTSTN